MFSWVISRLEGSNFFQFSVWRFETLLDTNDEHESLHWTALKIMLNSLIFSWWCPSNVSNLQTENWKKIELPRREITGKRDFESLITNASEDLRSGQNFPRYMCFEEPFYTPNIIFSSLPLPHVLHRSQFSEKKRNGKWQPNHINTTLQVNMSNNLLCGKVEKTSLALLQEA